MKEKRDFNKNQMNSQNKMEESLMKVNKLKLIQKLIKN